MLASQTDIRQMLDNHRYFVLGYGSLLSSDSRSRFSAIHCRAIPVSVHGWQRAWVTRSKPEQQTYVGARPVEGATLNATLLPLSEFSDDFKQREQDYQFTQVSLEHVQFHEAEQANSCEGKLQAKRLFICHTLEQMQAEPAFPVFQSYVDTCLTGCLEAGGKSFARNFLKHTEHIQNHWVNDRAAPRYPRYATLTQRQHATIDELLEEANLLDHRKAGA